jgi:acetylornithine deacetylase/succinyl-diaminopimelate desuccinylase-like protein
MAMTFSKQKLIWIKFKGEPREFPKVPEDQGLVEKFRTFLAEHNIKPEAWKIMGGGQFEGGFLPKYENALVVFFKENGCLEVPA